MSVSINHLSDDLCSEAAEALESLFRYLYEDTPKALDDYLSFYRAEDLMSRVGREDWIQLLAIDNRRVIGVAISYIDAGLGTLLWLYVAPSERASGIGSKLIEQTKLELINRNCHKMDVLARALLEHLRGFYQNRGFSYVALFPRYRYQVDTIYLDQDIR